MVSYESCADIFDGFVCSSDLPEDADSKYFCVSTWFVNSFVLESVYTYLPESVQSRCCILL